jgi:hypothetical protein
VPFIHTIILYSVFWHSKFIQKYKIFGKHKDVLTK